MPATYTPLRYPGGKSKLGSYLGSVMRANRLVDAVYAEPFAGGAGAGLHLLFRGYASRVHLNDIDRGVAAFWRAVLRHNEAFARLVERVPLTVAEWDRQKDALRTERAGFELGFAFFYLNRTNRSGIMNAGIIGGRDQRGEWSIDARFNRDELSRRIRALAAFRRQISVSCADALKFLDGFRNAGTKLFTYLDPPYYAKGQHLYQNFYTAADHLKIAKYLASYEHRWLMTYDSCDEIRALYPTRQILDSELGYSARDVRRGSEVVIFGPGLRIPPNHESPNAKKRRRAGFELVS